MDGMANRMGMMVGGVEKCFDSDWYHRLFLQKILIPILSRNIGIMGHYQFSALSPLGTKGRQE